MTAAVEPATPERSGKWHSTAAGGLPPVTSVLDLTTLGEHVVRCGTSRGPFFAMRCHADNALAFLRPKVISVALAGLALLALAAFVLDR